MSIPSALVHFAIQSSWNFAPCVNHSNSIRAEVVGLGGISAPNRSLEAIRNACCLQFTPFLLAVTAEVGQITPGKRPLLQTFAQAGLQIPVAMQTSRYRSRIYEWFGVRCELASVFATGFCARVGVFAALALGRRLFRSRSALGLPGVCAASERSMRDSNALSARSRASGLRMKRWET
jgi:hypothetical protein